MQIFYGSAVIAEKLSVFEYYPVYEEYSLRNDINTGLMDCERFQDFIQSSRYPSFKFRRCIQDVIMCMLQL